MLHVAYVRQDRGTDWFEQGEPDRGLASFIAVTYGRIVYWMGKRKIILEKGDFLFVPAFADYYAKSIPSVFHEKYVVSFSCGEAAARVPLFGEGRLAHARMGMYEWMIERLKTMHEEWTEQAPYADLRAEAILSELAVLWSRENLREPATDAAVRMAERMKAYIAGHYRERVTKEELGECIGRTPNHAAALFKRVIGQTISAYVHAVRIKTAVYMLSDSLLTVAEISEYLGYRDVSYFQRIFKRTTGRIPSDYMRDRP
ncbi:helix-turn-helix domain-containing protein [Cohnella nanjingensis]|uniref:Helix-turn-helix transcriptional regulator n=1 Tax=Cohnella nanjingensis TaxID=1387779 RepID=A0A7X0RVB5_9BACL|nr:AraC family transcriptional regulator [Cohnella nanjingensis]MBB6672769.1 helix-turn-helix transcriptional regulator [Cohnella nanjingensis]